MDDQRDRFLRQLSRLSNSRNLSDAFNLETKWDLWVVYGLRENTRRAFSLDGIWNLTHRSDTEESNEVKSILYQESGKKQNCQQPFYHKSKKKKNRFGAWNWQIYTAIFKTEINKSLLYSIRNAAQHNNLNGKRMWKRIDTWICINASLCCTPETNTI